MSEAECRPIPAEQEPASGKIKFLIIDDEKNILKMMELFFEDSPVQVTTANSAQKGLDEVCNERYDVVLCDFSMDGMNGLQLCEAAKEHACRTGRPKTPCLLYTGLNQKLDPAELARCGVDGVVRKPIACSDLQRIVQETIAKVRKEKAEA